MFDRKAVLAEVAYDSNWITVKNWIADMVRVEPTVMRRVAQREFGNLGQWIQRGSKNVDKLCGCLIGSTALELVNARNHFKPKPIGGGFDLTVPLPESCAAKGVELRDGGYVDTGYSWEWRSDAVERKNFDAYEVVVALSKATPEFIARMESDTESAGLAASELGQDIGQANAVALIKSEIRLQLALRNKRIRAGRKSASRLQRTKTGRFKKAA